MCVGGRQTINRMVKIAVEEESRERGGGREGGGRGEGEGERRGKGERGEEEERRRGQEWTKVNVQEPLSSVMCEYAT